MLSREEAVAALSYDPSSGTFTWKAWRGGLAAAGSIAGSVDSKGYIQIRLAGKLHLAHRLAWLYVHGAWPVGHLDHIDRNPRNNAIANLRLCTHAQNHQNVGIRCDNTSGVTGVSWNRKSGKWLAYINLNGKRTRLGLFDDRDAAIEARHSAKAEIHKFHPRQPRSAERMTKKGF